MHVAISPDCRRIVSSCEDGTVKSWLRGPDGSYAFERVVTAFPAEAIFVEFDRDGLRIACTSDAGMLRVLDLEGNPLEDFRIDSPLRCCRFSPDGSRVCATTGDGRFVTWFLDHEELKQRAQALLERATVLLPR